MFGKEKKYRQVSFPPETIEIAHSEFKNILKAADDELYRSTFGYASGKDEQTSIKNSEPHHRRGGVSSDWFAFRMSAKNSDRALSIIKNDYSLIVRIDDVPDLSGPIEYFTFSISLTNFTKCLSKMLLRR